MARFAGLTSKVIKDETCIWGKPALNAKATEQIKLLMKDRGTRPTDLAKTYRMSRPTVCNAAKEAA